MNTTSESATPRQRGAGILMMLSAAASNQTGAALGAMAFPVMGPVGVVAIRQLLTATVLTATVRPRLRGLGRDQWYPILGLAFVFSTMNLSLYLAVDRVGLGLAVTLEFIGPLTVAITSSRRPLDMCGAALAGVGVVVLVDPGPTTDVVGIAAALVAAAAWGAYILLNRTLGQRLSGLQGTAAASLVSAAAWAPIALVWFAFHIPTAYAAALAFACGMLASIAPYVADLLALRRVPAHVFATLTSINPVWAASSGCFFLHQALELNEWVGIAMIVISNIAVCARRHERKDPQLASEAPPTFTVAPST